MIAIIIIRTLVLNEVRLRMRRLATMVALLAVVAISWAMIDDPSSGSALLVVGKARVLYTSSALALGSASLASLLFGLGGFYLVRGRMAEDIRSGTGSVIGATQADNGLFLCSRWLGGAAYLGALVLAFMGTMLVCHALHGDGPIEPMVYAQTYALLLVPMVFFAVSCAILFDSYAPLMSKGGDILFFFIWMAQIGLVSQSGRSHSSALVLAMLCDFTGMSTSMATLGLNLDTTQLSIGSSPFDPAVAPVTLPVALWSAQMALMRGMSALLALLPLLPAIFLFHRFSPDRVKVAAARKRRTPLDMLNGWLRPLSRLVRPLFGLAAALPGTWGQVVADMALTLIAAPSAIVALAVALAASLIADASALGTVMTACVAFWGILVSDMSTRDFQADTESMTGAVQGGVTQRYLRQLGASVLLGGMFMGVIALRWSFDDPVRGAAAVAGILALSAVASLFGRCSRSARTFLSLFLFALYAAVNATRVALFDAVGFNHAADAQSAFFYLALGLGAAAAGYAWNRRQAR